MRSFRSLLILLTFISFFVAVALWLVLFIHSIEKPLEVVFLDVGQGDAIFIETPKGEEILIDGGRDNSVLRGLSQVMPFWDRSIDLVIATHPDADHIGGIVDVLRRYKVKAILDTEVENDTPAFISYSQEVQKEKARSIDPVRGSQLFFDNVVLTILSKESSVTSDPNDASIIVRLDYGETSFLLTGDADKKTERELLGFYDALEADVLKVGHHGSSTSTASEFVSAVSPEFAVISVGEDNSYGHPTDEVLNTLEKQEVEILRTDEDGMIRFESNGDILVQKDPGFFQKLIGI
ncbi:MAG: ComEC/Rec2 family competence protein [Candidatus Campbellbacteria bacterium]|nr:ComEC/Rec2 family competence protein [Candidatus Campbellbacteria bacterium]